MQPKMIIWYHSSIVCIAHSYMYEAYMLTLDIPHSGNIGYTIGTTYPYITLIYGPLYIYLSISSIELYGTMVL